MMSESRNISIGSHIKGMTRRGIHSFIHTYLIPRHHTASLVFFFYLLELQLSPPFYFLTFLILANRFWGYVAVCVQLYCRCFTVLHLVFADLHYIFRPTWPSSGVYDVLLYIPEGMCFAVFVAFSCTWLHCARFHLCFSVVFFSVNFLILYVCLPACLFLLLELD
jgi:hypothetical protein